MGVIEKGDAVTNVTACATSPPELVIRTKIGVALALMYTLPKAAGLGVRVSVGGTDASPPTVAVIDAGFWANEI